MRFSHFVRRCHVYLALLLLPWILTYGVSSAVINHHEWLRHVLDDGRPEWTVKAESDYDRSIPADASVSAIGREIAESLQLDGRMYANRPTPDKLVVNVQRTWKSTRVTYAIPQKKLKVEERKFQWNHLMVHLHERSGFQQEPLLQDAWGVAVDLATGGMLVLIASGLWMWWQLKRLRWPGALTIVAGAATFGTLVLAL